MATSGTTAFDLSIDDIVEEAYERCGLSTNSGYDLKKARRGLNVLFSESVEWMKFIIYNPAETNFLKSAKKNGNKIENGKKMFIFQAQASFKIWNNLEPKVDDKVMELLNWLKLVF